jgi:hypothetical protein
VTEAAAADEEVTEAAWLATAGVDVTEVDKLAPVVAAVAAVTALLTLADVAVDAFVTLADFVLLADLVPAAVLVAAAPFDDPDVYAPLMTLPRPPASS